MPHPAVRLVQIVEQPIDVAATLTAVEDPSDGGVSVFVGRVRDHDGGQGVRGLGYSAHPTALARLQEVCEQVAQRHDVHGLAAVHRVGELGIGDVAVVTVASSAHRDTAFTACRDLIDTLKAEVPIWKHQRFTDGTEEWVGAP